MHPAPVSCWATAPQLPFRRVFDAVFSGATFHWILDHAALFRSIVTALRPGGRLVAQCGGAGNLAELFGRVPPADGRGAASSPSSTNGRN